MVASGCARGWTLPQSLPEGDAASHDVSWFPPPGGDVISLDAGTKRDVNVSDARLDATDARTDANTRDAAQFDARASDVRADAPRTDASADSARDALVASDTEAGAITEDAALPQDVPRDVGGLLECRAHALELAERCSGNARAVCLWRAYAAMCERGNPTSLIDAMSCFGASGCGTFSGSEAQTCVARVYETHTTAYSRLAQFRMRFYCSNDRLFGPTSELQWSHFNPDQLLRSQGCVTEESSCSTIDACFRRDFPEFVACGTAVHDVRQPLDWLF